MKKEKEKSKARAKEKAKEVYRFPAGLRTDDPDGQKERIRLRLSKAGERNIRYDDDDRFVFCFMGTVPNDMAIEAYRTFLLAHPNNIGEHTRGINEMGFPGTQQLEREVISMIGDLHGDPTVDGYLSFDGTEANIQGCWVGREWLVKNTPKSKPKNDQICLLVSHFHHYSIEKAYNVLGLNGGFVDLPTDKNGAVLVSAMEKAIIRRYNGGKRRFLIVAIAGSTLLGSVDNVTAIGEMIKRLEAKYNHPGNPRSKRIGLYLHVDAAFGGFVAPFLPNPIEIGFNAHERVSSMSIDPHKMGLIPYPAGAFLCRNGLIKLVERHVGYIGGHSDVTLCGSRPGAAAAACWAGITMLGRRGYEVKVKRCMEVLRYVEREMGKIKGIRLFTPTTNILAFAILNRKFKKVLEILADWEKKGLQYNENLPPNFPAKYRKLAEDYRRLQSKYILFSDEIPSDLSNIRSTKVRIIRFVLMPHPWLLEKGERVFHDFLAEFRTLFSE